MTSKRFLVKFGTSSKVVSITHTDTLKDSIKEAFGLDSYESEDVLLQRYDKIWEDYIDLDDQDLTDLKYHDKLQFSVKPKHQVSSSDLDSSYTIYIDSRNSISEESSTSTSTHCEAWPTQFSLPKEKYSTQLKHHLEREMPLDWNCKHELLGVIVDEVFKYTFYPNAFEVSSAAKCLIHSYPYLTEKIGSGYDGWMASIRDKLKNTRRKLDIPVVSCRKRKSNSAVQNENETSLKRRRVAHGSNAFPCMPEGEDGGSSQTQIDEMKVEMKSPGRDNTKIRVSMDKTYAYRRKLVNECAPIRVILNEYPALEMVDFIDEELCRVINKTDTMKTYKNNCSRYSSGLLELVKKREKEYVSRLLQMMENTVNDLLEQTPSEVARIETITAMILLSDIFKEDQRNYINIYELGTSLEDVRKEPRTPHLAIIGSPFNPVAVYSVIEGEIACTVKTVLEAIYVAFCAYNIFNIEYPKAALNTWSCIQFISRTWTCLNYQRLCW